MIGANAQYIETLENRCFIFICLFIWLFRVLVAPLGSFVVTHRLFSWGTWIQLLGTVWELNSPTRARACVPCMARQILNHWTTGEAPDVLLIMCKWYFQWNLKNFTILLCIDKYCIWAHIWVQLAPPRTSLVAQMVKNLPPVLEA